VGFFRKGGQEAAMTDQEPRWDKIKEAKWRIENGYYDMPFVLKESIDALFESVLNEPEETPHEDEQRTQDP